MVKQTKDAKVFFRLTPRDKERLEKMARKQGFENPSAWIRRLVLEALKQQAA